MTLEFVAPTTGADPMRYAQNDVSSLPDVFPGFKQIGLAASTEVANAVVLGFQADGTSSVTGRSYSARGDRYYVLLPDGRLAILTVVGPDSHYDREGVRDIALTLKVSG